MKPTELYNRKPESENNDVFFLVDKSFIPEAGINIYDLHISREGVEINIDKVDIKVLADYESNWRSWTVCTVWFNNNPVMVTQNAGREGTDYCCKFITDLDLYNKMIQHIRSEFFPFVPSNILGGAWNEHNCKTRLVDKDEEVKDLANFYGRDIDLGGEDFN